MEWFNRWLFWGGGLDQSESKEKDPETGKTDGAKSDAGSESEVSCNQINIKQFCL